MTNIFRLSEPTGGVMLSLSSLSSALLSVWVMCGGSHTSALKMGVVSILNLLTACITYVGNDFVILVLFHKSPFISNFRSLCLH